MKNEESLDSLKFHCRNAITTAITKMMSMTRQELLQATQNPDATITEVMVGSMIVKAIEDSDQSRMSMLLSYIAPKPQEKKAKK
jgi:hypothetical protein